MSGTSMDGLDCGLFEIYLTPEYHLNWECIDFNTYSYQKEIRASINHALEGDEVVIMEVDKKLGKEYSLITYRFIKDRNIDLIATHGQTISHEGGIRTRQIGTPQYLQKIFQVPVVSNFRQADIRVGGNGAPLMPFLDWLLFKESSQNTITLNLGGVANISYIPKSGKRSEVLGFDTGPGMALIDESCWIFFEESFDKDGVHASSGKVNQEVLKVLMAHDFIQKIPPKSTGRQEFGRDMVNEIIQSVSHISPDDMIRTFCAFTAKSIAENLDKYLNITASDCCIIISGGGVYHPILMDDIRNSTKISNIKTSADIGISPDMKESLLMAILGVARLLEIPANMPPVTGAGEMVVLGDVIKNNW